MCTLAFYQRRSAVAITPSPRSSGAEVVLWRANAVGRGGTKTLSGGRVRPPNGLGIWGTVPLASSRPHGGSCSGKPQNAQRPSCGWAFGVGIMRGIPYRQTQPLDNIRSNVQVRIPVRADGSFDLTAQQRIADRYDEVDSVQALLLEQLKALSDMRYEWSYADQAASE